MNQAELEMFMAEAQKCSGLSATAFKKVRKEAQAKVKRFKSKLNRIQAKTADPDKPVPEKDQCSLKKNFHFVEKLWGKILRYNEFTKEIELDGQPIDIGKAKLRLALNHNRQIGLDNLELILMELAERNNYHPVREYLEKCGQQSTQPGFLDNLAQRYLCTTDPIYDAYLKRTLIGAVARIFEPGCKFDTALILQGSQGLGKSTFFKILAGGDDYFDDSLGDAGDKDERLKIHQSFFLEMAELESVFRRKDIAKIKAFLSSGVDNVRPPYARQAVRMPRQSIIVGTTNQDEFLSDATGNRRFWVIPAQKVDLELVRLERDQIWAAAVAAYRAGEKCYLSQAEALQAAEAVKDYQTSDPWQNRVETYLQEHQLSQVTTGEILFTALEIEVAHQGRREQMRVAEILKTIGWQRQRVTIHGKRQYAFIKPEVSEVAPAKALETSTAAPPKAPPAEPEDDGVIWTPVAPPPPAQPLTEALLVDFTQWNADEPATYQTELSKLTQSEREYLYCRVPELRSQPEVTHV